MKLLTVIWSVGLTFGLFACKQNAPQPNTNTSTSGAHYPKKHPETSPTAALQGKKGFGLLATKATSYPGAYSAIYGATQASASQTKSFDYINAAQTMPGNPDYKQFQFPNGQWATFKVDAEGNIMNETFAVWNQKTGSNGAKSFDESSDLGSAAIVGGKFVSKTTGEAFSPQQILENGLFSPQNQKAMAGTKLPDTGGTWPPTTDAEAAKLGYQNMADFNKQEGILSTQLSQRITQDANGNRYEYDANGNVSMVMDKYGRDISDNSKILQDANGRITQDANGNTYKYDQNGNVSQVIDPQGKDISDNSKILVGPQDFQPAQLPVRISQDASGNVYKYDQNGNVSQVLDSKGNDISDNSKILQDANGRITQDAAGNKYNYDANGNVSQVVSPSGEDISDSSKIQYDQ